MITFSSHSPMRIVFMCMFIFNLNLVVAQLDTLALKMQINEINTEKNHVDFWATIYERDQNMMNSNQIEMINLENLVLVSYYLNKFGYPDIEVLGEKAKIINMVWLHNKYAEVKKVTYPIILQGYLKKEISEFNLREYFLRILYQRYFDDHGNMSKALSQIYKELQPNVSGQINVNAFVQYYIEQEKYFRGDKIVIGTWKSDDIQYVGTLNGGSFSQSIPGDSVTIFKMSDGNYFLHTLVKGQSIEPKELSALDEEGTSFRFSQLQSRSSYQVTEKGDLIYRDEKGNTLSIFHPFNR